jgi:hypothetical protein
MRFLRRGLFLGVAGLSLLGVVGCTEDNEKSSGIMENKGSGPANSGTPVQYGQKPPSGPESFKGSGYPGADKGAPKAAPKAEDKAPEK